MTKRKMLRYLIRRIEHLERRVADLEAIAAARPAEPEAEPVPWWWVPGVPLCTYTVTASEPGDLES